jgi:hypothetical protein
LPLAFGASPRLGIPSLRSCSVGPPRWAILGPARLTRHPCRVAHCAEPERSLSMGQENQDQKPKPKPPVGAGLPAMIVNDDAGNLTPRGAVRFFASRLAPTGISLALALALALLWLLLLIYLPHFQRPNAGVAQWASRHGCRDSRPRPWMADGGGPTEQCRSEGMPSLSEAPNGGARPFGSFCGV